MYKIVDKSFCGTSWLSITNAIKTLYLQLLVVKKHIAKDFSNPDVVSNARPEN